MRNAIIIIWHRIGVWRWEINHARRYVAEFNAYLKNKQEKETRKRKEWTNKLPKVAGVERDGRRKLTQKRNGGKKDEEKKKSIRFHRISTHTSGS